MDRAGEGDRVVRFLPIPERDEELARDRGDYREQHGPMRRRASLTSFPLLVSAAIFRRLRRNTKITDDLGER
jgi:hypothetical protein